MSNIDNRSKKHDIDEELATLSKIRKVDAPPYLFTRIKAEINEITITNAEAPSQWKWAFAVTFIIMIALNLSVLFKTGYTEKNTEAIKEVISAMSMTNNNNLYPDNE